MFDSARKAVRKTKKFVTDHPTVAACAVTAVITAKITKVRVTNAQLEELKGFIYSLGYEAGEADAYNTIVHQFVTEKGLQDDLRHFTTEIFTVKPA